MATTYKSWLFKAGEDKVLLVDYKGELEHLYELLNCSHIDAVTIPTKLGTFSIYFNDNGLYEETVFNKPAKQVLGKLPVHWGTFNGNFLVTLSKTWEEEDEEDELRLDMPKISFKDWIAMCAPVLLAFEIQKQKKLNELMARGVPAFFL